MARNRNDGPVLIKMAIMRFQVNDYKGILPGVGVFLSHIMAGLALRGT